MKSETSKNQKTGIWTIKAFENGVEYASGSGSSLKEAAKWVVHHANRMAANVEEFVIEAGYLTAEEVEQVADMHNVTLEVVK